MMEHILYHICVAICIIFIQVYPSIAEEEADYITIAKSHKSYFDVPTRESGGRQKRQVSYDGTIVNYSSQEKTDILERHRKLRSQVSPEAANMEYMYWDDDLATMGETWSSACIWEHDLGRLDNISPYSSFGQNLWLGSGRLNSPPGGTGPTNAWYNEVNQYDYENRECSGVCGHYTQVVWAKSIHLGCGRAFCESVTEEGSHHSSNVWIMTCHYSPAGNYQGVRPYISGPSCSQCESGSGSCFENQCRNCKEDNVDDCDCGAICNNCGTLDKEECSCTCMDGWYSPDCSKECVNMHENCGKSPGWPNAGSCRLHQSIPKRCPLMCGLCEAANPDETCDPDKSMTTARMVSMMTDMPGPPDMPDCKDGDFDLGLENGDIGNHQLTASSFYDDGFEAWNGRLHNVKQYWATAYSEPHDDWLQVDLKGNFVLTGIVTQGGKADGNLEWTEELQVQYGNAEKGLRYILEDGSPKNFTANSDHKSAVEITFPRPIMTRYLRIVPTSCSSWCSLRLEITGCTKGFPLSPACVSGRVELQKRFKNKDYNRPESEAYRRLATSFSNSMNKLMTDTYGERFKETVVERFRKCKPGPCTIVEFSLKFHGDPSLDHDVPMEDRNDTAKAVLATLNDALKTGKLGPLPVKPGPVEVGAPRVYGETKVTTPGTKGGFIGEIDIRIPVDTRAWTVTLNFPKNVYSLRINDAEIVSKQNQGKFYRLKNHPWNGRLEEGSTLTLWFWATVFKKIEGGFPAEVVFIPIPDEE